MIENRLTREEYIKISRESSSPRTRRQWIDQESSKPKLRVPACPPIVIETWRKYCRCFVVIITFRNVQGVCFNIASNQSKNCLASVCENYVISWKSIKALKCTLVQAFFLRTWDSLLWWAIRRKYEKKRGNKRIWQNFPNTLYLGAYRETQGRRILR